MMLASVLALLLGSFVFGTGVTHAASYRQVVYTVTSINDQNELRKIYSSASVITRDEVPNLK